MTAAAPVDFEKQADELAPWFWAAFARLRRVVGDDCAAIEARRQAERMVALQRAAGRSGGKEIAP